MTNVWYIYIHIYIYVCKYASPLDTSCSFYIGYKQYCHYHYLNDMISLSGWWFQPLWKTWKSVGIGLPNICKNNQNIPKCSKPPSRYDRLIKSDQRVETWRMRASGRYTSCFLGGLGDELDELGAAGERDWPMGQWVPSPYNNHE